MNQEKFSKTNAVRIAYAEGLRRRSQADPEAPIRSAASPDEVQEAMRLTNEVIGDLIDEYELLGRPFSALEISEKVIDLQMGGSL